MLKKQWRPLSFDANSSPLPVVKSQRRSSTHHAFRIMLLASCFLHHAFRIKYFPKRKKDCENYQSKVAGEIGSVSTVLTAELIVSPESWMLRWMPDSYVTCVYFLMCEPVCIPVSIDNGMILYHQERPSRFFSTSRLVALIRTSSTTEVMLTQRKPCFCQ